MKKVMIIDDDEKFLAEISESLKSHGYQVSTFADGEQAIKKIKKDKPDIIFLDMKMGRVSGLQVADVLKRSVETKSIPIISITGVYKDDSHQAIMKTFGIIKCLTKPLKLDVVIDIIENVG